MFSNFQCTGFQAACEAGEINQLPADLIEAYAEQIIEEATLIERECPEEYYPELIGELICEAATTIERSEGDGWYDYVVEALTDRIVTQ